MLNPVTVITRDRQVTAIAVPVATQPPQGRATPSVARSAARLYPRGYLFQRFICVKLRSPSQARSAAPLVLPPGVAGGQRSAPPPPERGPPATPWVSLHLDGLDGPCIRV